MDSSCVMSVINKRFLQQVAPGAAVQHPKTTIYMRGLRVKKHTSNKYVVLDLFPVEMQGKLLLAQITQEFHLVDQLDMNILVRMDVQSPEGILLNCLEGTITFQKTDNTVTKAMTETQAARPVKALVRTKGVTRLQSRTVTNILFYFILFDSYTGSSFTAMQIF